MSNTKHFYGDIAVRIHQNSEQYKRSFYVFNSCRSIINARTVVLLGWSLSLIFLVGVLTKWNIRPPWWGETKARLRISCLMRISLPNPHFSRFIKMEKIGFRDQVGSYHIREGTSIKPKYWYCRGTAVAQWLRCCDSNLKVTGSTPAGVSGFSIDIKSFRSHYGPGVDSISNRNEYQEYFLGGKGGRCGRLTTYHHPVPLSCNLGTLTSWNPLGLSRPVMGLLYLFTDTAEWLQM